MNPEMPHDPREADTLPPGLVDALRACDPAPVTASAEHDAALLAGAREHLAGIAIHQHERRGRSRYVLAFIGAGGAVAAAAALSFAVWVNTHPGAAEMPALAQHEADLPDSAADPDSRQPADGVSPGAGAVDEAPPPTDTHARPGTHPGATPGALVGDLDQSGTVDILDAFALARAIQDDGPAARSRESDFNRDGRVDLQDADWLAEQAVSLRRNGGRG